MARPALRPSPTWAIIVTIHFEGGRHMEEQKRAQSTARERVVAAYKGGFADRVPAYPIAGTFAGCLDGLSIEYCCLHRPPGDAELLRALPARYRSLNDLAKRQKPSGAA
jgi:hypothetical protein